MQVVICYQCAKVLLVESGVIMNRNRKCTGLFSKAMSALSKYLTSLLIAVSMALTPVVSVFATSVTDSSTHMQDKNEVPCHEMASGVVDMDESAQSSDTDSCKYCCEDGVCQDKHCSSSCILTIQLSAITSLTLLIPHKISTSYQADRLDNYPGLIQSPAFRPPIS